MPTFRRSTDSNYIAADLEKDQQVLLIIDDFIGEAKKDKDLFLDVFIKGRKCQCTTMFLSQSNYSIPIDMRRNASKIIIQKIGDKRDLASILRNFPIDISLDVFKQIYDYCTRRMFGFMKIEVFASDDNKRISENWSNFIQLK
jgi:hypothetical protein